MMDILDNELVKKRFLSKVQKTDGCWIWTGNRNRRCGHGRFYLNYRLITASRAAYKLFVGEVPENKFVLLKCDNGPCVRFDHLYLGNNSDNMKDAIARGQLKPTPGELHPRAKLTWDKVREIRKLKPSMTIANLAIQFGVSDGCIATIVSGHRWKESI